MPELPEVETTVRGLRKSVVGKPIAGASSKTHQLFESKRVMRQVGELLSGDQIEKIERRGKYLVFRLASHRTLIAHMKMSGRFLASVSVPVGRPIDTDKKDGKTEEMKKEKNDLRHVRLLFEFDDGTRLSYFDVRKFGRVWLFPDTHLEAFFEKRKLAHDALSPLCTEAYLHTQLSRNRGIKSLLLDQTCVAGIGNIYADETLWKAKIHPLRKGSSLTEAEVGRIYQSIGAILKEAIKAGGTSLRDYARPDGSLGYFQSLRRVYQRAGEPCPRCRSKIKRIVVAQRGTHYCPRCQRL